MTEVKTDRSGADDGAAAPADECPVLESRRRRLRAYLRHNAGRIRRDTTLVLAWALLSTIAYQEVGLPRWTYYVVTFVGVVVYTRATTPWSRPYSSPDDFESPSATGRRLQKPKQRHD